MVGRAGHPQRGGTAAVRSARRHGDQVGAHPAHRRLRPRQGAVGGGAAEDGREPRVRDQGRQDGGHRGGARNEPTRSFSRAVWQEITIRRGRPVLPAAQSLGPCAL
eukprot:1181464-Prorocentrum_minimum.AAC.3